MTCEHKCIKFCILTKGFYYFDSNSHRRRRLIEPTDGLYEKSEMLLHFINTSMTMVISLARLSKAKSTTHGFAQAIMKKFLNRKLTTQSVSA